jgi:hypothetical protein
MTDDIASNTNSARNRSITACSYLYEFSSALFPSKWTQNDFLGFSDPNLDTDGNGLSWYEVKVYQLNHGDAGHHQAYDPTIFPVVRCFHHYAERKFKITNPGPDEPAEQNLTINIAYAGNVFHAPMKWESTGKAK